MVIDTELKSVQAVKIFIYSSFTSALLTLKTKMNLLTKPWTHFLECIMTALRALSLGTSSTQFDIYNLRLGDLSMPMIWLMCKSYGSDRSDTEDWKMFPTYHCCFLKYELLWKKTVIREKFNEMLWPFRNREAWNAH